MTELQRWGWERCACWKPVRKEPVKDVTAEREGIRTSECLALQRCDTPSLTIREKE